MNENPPFDDPPIRWAAGDICLLEYEGQTVTACVQLASRNGRSLMLSFQAMLGGYVGAMPLLWYHREGTYRDLIRWQPATLKAMPGETAPKGST